MTSSGGWNTVAKVLRHLCHVQKWGWGCGPGYQWVSLTHSRLTAGYWHHRNSGPRRKRLASQGVRAQPSYQKFRAGLQWGIRKIDGLSRKDLGNVNKKSTLNRASGSKNNSRPHPLAEEALLGLTNQILSLSYWERLNKAKAEHKLVIWMFFWTSNLNSLSDVSIMTWVTKTRRKR